MRVKTYIGLLSAGGLGGALIGIFGWWMLASNAKSNRELKEESRNSGASSAEYRDVLAFLNLSRGVFEAMEIYPKITRAFMEWQGIELVPPKRV